MAGRGGVVRYSASHQSHMFQPQFLMQPLPRPSKELMMVLVVKRARRGVGNRGLPQEHESLVECLSPRSTGGFEAGTYLASLSIRKFWERSAAKLAVGEEPWTPLTLK